ncbi:MAG: NADH:ubiquinone reductase (Na(+)-transporting) subunit F [Desulfobacterales bacterium]|nr:NADH:ubiquinone reductase (Na(+)-transporting) subunit F [Desulfobacterales bacterium]
MIYLVSLSVFIGVILFLVAVLIVVEQAVTIKGERSITINGNCDDPILVKGTPTLLSALLGNGVLLPSACGGSGSCGMCKCVVNEGGGEILPTELSLVSRKERMEKVRMACQLKVKADMVIQVPEEIFSICRYSGTVASNENVSTFIKELIIDLDDDAIMDFKAGSYIQIDIPPYDISFKDFQIQEMYREDWDAQGLWSLSYKNEENAFRAYSMANPPSDNRRVMLNVRIATPPPEAPNAPPGVGSTYLFNLKPGDKVTLSGPYGEFFVQETDREMCFIGGGAGMAPMRGHIFHQLNTLRSPRPMTFWYGARSRREMFYDEEYTDLVKAHDNFAYHVALSSPLSDDAWEGATGFIHTAVYENFLKRHPDPSEVEYYLCGPPLMIDAVLDMLDDMGVEEEMIRFDKFS